MSCNITYNQNGGVAKVLTPSNQESRLFNQISKLPHINSLEEALDIYKTTYAKGGLYDVEDKESIEEPNLTFKSDKGNMFTTFKEALKDSFGGNVDVMVRDSVLTSISSNSNPQEINGLINNLIKSDILNDERIVEDGQSYLKAEGYDQAKAIVNEVVLTESAPNAKIFKDGRIQIQEKLPLKEDTSEQGKLIAQVDEAVKAAQPKPLGMPLEAPVGEQALTDRLTNFLNSIGVKITSIEEYSKNYAQRNGIPVSAEALADISNQIVAFREGRITEENLSEETSHFIVEAWNQDEIANLLRNIHKTDSYQKHAQTYREIYTRENPNMISVEIEELVRKEVLGKELANALVTRFNTEGKNESQVNILQRIYDLVVDFFKSVTLRDNYKQQLEDLTNKVQDLLITQDVNKYLDTTQYKGKKFKLYQIAPNPKAVSQINLLNGLIEQEKVLLNIGRGSVNTLKKLEGMLSDEIENKALQDLIGLAKRQTRYIKEAIAAANRRNTTLSNEENIVFKNLSNVIRPALAQLSTGLKGDPNFKTSVVEMEDLLKNITENEGLVLNAENDLVERVIDRLMKRYNLEDTTIRVKDANGQMVDMNVRDHLRNSIHATQKDTNTLYSYFGQITHASDPLLNLLGSVIGDMYIDTGKEFHNNAKEFQKRLREEGFKEQDLPKLMQEDGYIISQWDFSAFQEFLKYAKVEAYQNNLDSKNVDGKHVIGIIDNLKDRISKGEKLQDELAVHEANKAKDTKQLLEDFKGYPVISDEKLRLKVTSEAQETVNKGSETVLSEEYIKKQKKLLDDLGISEATRVVLKGFSEMRGQIKRNTITSANGVPIYTTQNKYDLEFLNIQRRKASSPYTELGKEKNGLFVNTYPMTSESVMINKTDYLSIDRTVADEEAIIAFDMAKLTADFLAEKNKKGAVSFNNKLDRTTHAKFYADLEAMVQDPEVKREDILSFFNLNTQVGFSKEFFAGDREDIFAEFENDDAVRDDIKEYKDLLAKRRAVVNQYRDSNNGVNTLAENIPLDIKKEILDNTRRIETLSSGIFMYIKGKNKDKADEVERQQRDAETGANEAYFGALEDNNLTTFEEKFKFSLEHMTDSSRKKVEDYREAVKSGFIPERLAPLIAKHGRNEAGILKYAQSKLLPYYASYAPIALQEFYDKARNSNENMLTLIEELNASPDVRISVSYDYLDSSDPTILNPHRDKEFKGGYQQPTLRNKPTVLGKQFDFANKNWSKISGDARLKKLHDMYIQFHEGTLDNLGEKGTHNVYLAPQVSKSTMEGAHKILKGKDVQSTIGEWLQEMRNFRVDEMVQGAEAEGKSLINSGMRVIPKYYLKNLERADDVSTDLFYSMMVMSQQASLYKNRKEKYAEISALYDTVSNNQRRYPNGKQADATNTYRMFKSQMDYALFGVQEQAMLRVSLPVVGEVNFTKAIKTLHKYKQNLALGLNLTIPVTSALTAHSGLFTERLMGQYIDSDSLNQANREFRKISSDAITESMDVNSTSKLSIVGEYMNVFDLDKRFENSKYGVYKRILGRSMYIAHTAGNFSALSTATLGVLYGNRIFGNKIVDYNQFKLIKQNSEQTVSDSDIKAEWKGLKSIYEYMDTSSGTLKYNPAIYKDLNVTPEEFKNLENGLLNKSKALVERIDGQIPNEERVIAQRNFMLSFLMSHRGWLSIMASNRFKGRQLNLKTGQVEEGTYITAGNYVKNIIEAFIRKDWEAIKNQFKNSTPNEQQNLIRILKEFAVLSGLTLLAIAANTWGDEEPDSYLAQATAYLSERVRNETASVQVGLVGELYQAMKDPIVGISQLENMAKVHEIVSTEEVKTGRYAGMTESERYIIRNLVGAKSLYDLYDAENLKSQRESYEYFQGSQSVWVNPLGYLLEKEDEE